MLSKPVAAAQPGAPGTDAAQVSNGTDARFVDGRFPASDPVVTAESDPARRFGGVGRIYGAAALDRFRRARVAVVGLGGVGSWVVEALARSAIGQLTLIDLDHVSESNINRQLQALSDTLGQAKVEALRERISGINPQCRVVGIEEFVDADNVAQLLPADGLDFVVDAVDDGRAKVALVRHCVAQRIPLVVVGSAGGQRHPERVRLSDLAHTEHDPLLSRVRKRLRTEHGFPRNLKTRFEVAAVYSDEPLAGNDPEDARAGLNCAGYGSSVAVTAVFGMVAAGHVLNCLARQPNGGEACPSEIPPHRP